ncbi:PilZ domain-containing protein [Bradyrhizobium elkanii]|uniref:PilZ domain-containing protein n=1 Tax=Bradyrhizobium elkanii TaxID=29448 RepID=UPI0009B71E5D|nr:PilZ domain-containing protein [Bradyrhizobium elkanii]MCS3567459.1 hypothetical protein [Bradyrhizobium elkanii]MCS3591056.1 hypothetical protein [Bradyrhizobium elkanii]MCS3620499.1 hypothetical protein [Bradyrhizobium elkanii]
MTGGASAPVRPTHPSSALQSTGRQAAKSRRQSCAPRQSRCAATSIGLEKRTLTNRTGYLDHIGRVEGRITRIIDNGFAMTIGATARKRDKLAAQLTWLANRDILNLPEDRRHDRIVPRNPIALLTQEDGTRMTCRIIDLSLSGAAIAAENRPPLKSLVMLGRVQARVVRNLEEGFALEFVHEQSAETLEESVTAR